MWEIFEVVEVFNEEVGCVIGEEGFRNEGKLSSEVFGDTLRLWKL